MPLPPSEPGLTPLGMLAPGWPFRPRYRPIRKLSESAWPYRPGVLLSSMARTGWLEAAGPDHVNFSRSLVPLEMPRPVGHILGYDLLGR